MRVFISWSGKFSHQVATLFADWLPGVIQECSDPFISSEVTKGDAWFEAITTNLKENELGVVFITADNMDSPWLNFEAGAMLSKLDKSGVRPVLVDLKKGDYKGPMSNLQLTELDDEADFLRLMKSINLRCANPLTDERLQKAFGASWNELAESVKKALAKRTAPEAKAVERTPDDKIDEILNLVRGIASEPTNDRKRASPATSRRTKVFASPEDLQIFEAKHGSLNAYLPDTKESGTVIDFREDSDGSLTAVYVQAPDGTRHIWNAPDFDIFPF